MMINKRLIGTVAESKKYIAGNVMLQWCSLAANIAMMFSITDLLAGLYYRNTNAGTLWTTAAVVAAALLIRFLCATLASRMSYLSSKAVKKTLRERIYEKLLRLGASYNEQVKTSEVVQVAVEGVDQLETYFGAYLPQFFYAMLAPLTLFAVLCFVNIPAAVVLLICVPLIPIAIAAVQTWAKKLLTKYWGQYTALGDTFLENLQGLTTLKIYQADEFKHKEMNAEAEKFRKITMKVLTMQLNSITIMDLILHGVDLQLPQGGFTALVGESGCGKSTIASILMGRNKGYTGSVSVGGVELKEISEISLLQNITYISHQSYLFKGTVRDNMLMGRPTASEEELWAVLERVNLAGFLKAEQGLDTPLLEKAGNLSGGQRQRLALARALLHDSPVYIFDEATSNIDMESENDIMTEIHKLAKQKTVVLISHRLANVVQADNIYVLENGCVAESGSHKELLNRHGLYERLWNAQQALENYRKEDGIA